MGLSRLSCWFAALGITPRFTVPGHPEHNGRHERLHPPQAEATSPQRRRGPEQARSTRRAEYNTSDPTPR
ncbi:MAG: hypothetical protein IPK33_02870 [Gemmatimonadetes bacterium]|nr:hypothetical protein [Gemmatimonadota bacterium]